jgi:signal peptidase
MQVTSPRAARRSGGVHGVLGRLALLGTFAVAWFVFLAPTGLGGPVGLIWVSGTSMEPMMHTGDLAVLYEQESYGEGDVVAFEIPGGGTVIHRIIAVENGAYRFQGDNRDFADPWLLGEDAIVGRRLTHVPHAGSVMSELGRPIVMAALVAVLALLSCLGPAWNSVVHRRMTGRT